MEEKMETKSTISNLFSPRKVSFKIPVYQRAFSWDVGENNDGQVPQFMKDLIDQPKGVQYYLGHFLFEMDLQHPDRHFVIDGQQRMTTIVIFFACLRNILKIKAPDVIVSEIEEDYLQNSKERVKFRTVDSGGRLGMTSLAVTDIGNMFGALEFYLNSGGYCND
jgi:uncharacterized protein with ParB-like and HNH nuclease domain